MGPLAARALGDQKAVLDERRRVVLDHLHVHQRRADVVGLRDAVARADEPVGRRLPRLAGAACGEDRRLGVEHLHPPAADVARDAADARAAVAEQQRRGEPLLVAVQPLVVLEQLLVEDVKQRLAGDVGDVVRARGRGAAEGAGAELALLVAVEGHPDVLEVKHCHFFIEMFWQYVHFVFVR